VFHQTSNPAAVATATGLNGIISSDSWDIHHHDLKVDSWRRFISKTSPLTIPKPVTDPLNLTMAQLSPGRVQCRFITNDDMRAPLYCGHPTGGNYSWCAHHKAVCVVPR
jgi:hypothetical protein